MTVEIHLLGQTERMAGNNPYGLDRLPLYHQMRTLEALKQSPLVMNTYNTGTGKTVASLLYLFELEGNRNDNVLFIAPTNELLHQHYTDVKAFVEKHDLPFLVLEANAKLLRELREPDVADRQGERLTRLIADPRAFFDKLGISPGESRKPVILVTNPDLFYYAFYWRFAGADQRNLFEDFVTKFRYIIIDEFHYYNSKQLANFLFFIVLSKEWGYFDKGGRKMCLLSATPTNSTRTYLDRALGTDGWRLISPQNEPVEAEGLPSIPVLAPTTLRIITEKMEDFAEEQAQTIRQWLNQGLHGAMISGALWRINSAYSSLSQVIPDSQMGRITGPQQVEQRRVDQFKALILATPTVDIGYNFIKHHKDRQNLDFVVFDARYRDEFTQRLGRTGRVLGKKVTDQPSLAIALVGESVERELASYDQQTMTRSELADVLRKLNSLPEKNEFSSYLKAGGLYENAYPLFKARTMFSSQKEQLLEDLYLRVRDVFAPDSRISFGQIKRQFHLESVIATWLREPNDSYTLQRIPDVLQEFTGWLMGERYHLSASQVQQYLSDSRITSGFRTYCEMQQALLQAQFSFRDSFSGPTAWVYDPYHLLSDTDVTQYDLIHILENYEVDFIEPGEWKSVTNEPSLTAAIRVYLRRQRAKDQRLRIRLRWVPPDMGMPGGWEEERFLRCFVAGDPVALKGVTFICDQPLARVFQQSLAGRYVTALLVPGSLEGAMRKALMDRLVYPRELQVTLPSGRELRFHAILGTNAFLIAPMLHYAFANSEKMRTDAIIC